MFAIISKFKNRILYSIIALMSSVLIYSVVKLSIVEKELTILKTEKTLLIEVNENNVKTITQLEKSINLKELIVLEYVKEIKELSSKKCETIKEIYTLPKKENKNEEVRCDIDDYIPVELDRLFESKGY